MKPENGDSDRGEVNESPNQPENSEIKGEENTSNEPENSSDNKENKNNSTDTSSCFISRISKLCIFITWLTFI